MARAAGAITGLRATMNASLKAYAAGDPSFFDYLQDDVRVFNLDSAEPMVGRKRFQSAFTSNFTKTKRRVKVVHSDLQPSGEQAVLSQTLEITTSGITTFMRQTVIWSRAKGEWKMSHIHNALVGQPVASVAKLPTSAKAIEVLNERIATVAAAVGVAQ